MTAHLNPGLATMTVGGREYPYKFVPSCKTCRSPLRQVIEEGLVSGRPFGAILADLPVDHDLSVRNVRDHLQADHLGVMTVAAERLREEVATSRGRVVEEGVSAVRQSIDFARLVLGRVVDRVAAGALQPDIRDGIAAAKLLAIVEGASGVEAETARLGEALVCYADAAAQVMSLQQRQEFAHRLEGYAVIRECLELEERRWSPELATNAAEQSEQ